MHPLAFEYLKPTDNQLAAMERVRAASKAFAEVLETFVPEGADRIFALRNHRTTVMWANVAITRYSDGSPRQEQLP